jgi:dynein heavy chain 1
LYALDDYLNVVFGNDFEWRNFSTIDLRDIVEKDSKSHAPLMLCSEAGQDASSKVDGLAVAMNKTLLSVSMGSTEGYTDANKSIAGAVKNGSWVLLRNVHLCADWLSQLEKKMHSEKKHDNFRLFLTCEIHPKLPSALLRLSEVLVFEASTGIKANIQRFYQSIPIARIERQPAERVRLYSLLAWLNAVIQERLRYVPLGWTKRHEFSEADAACALDVIDQWIDEVSNGRAHVNPIDLPWQALRTLLSQSLYGGRIDDPFDQVFLFFVFFI